MEAIPDLPPDPWNVLGVQRDADISTIRKAYRKLVLQTHPDKAPEKAAEFCLVQTAYETLSDSDKLKEYHSEVKEYEIYRRREQLLEELARQRDEKSQRATRSSMPRRSETFDTARPREKSYTFRTASPESYDDQSSDRQDDDSDEPRYSTHPRPRMRRSDTTEEHRSRRGFSERQSVRQEAGYFGSMPKHRPEPERERYQASRARAKKATDKARKHDQKMRRDQTTPHSSDDETDEDPPFSPQFEAAAAHIKRSRSSKAKKSAPSRSEFTDFFFGEGARFKLVPVDAMQHAARAHIERTKDRSGARSRPELHRSFPTAPADSPNRAARLQRSESSSGDDTVRQSSRHHADARDKPDSRTRRKGTEDRKAGVAVPPPPPKARSANAPPLSARSSHQESRTGSASAPRHGSVPDVSHRRSPPVERSTTSPAPSARKGSRPSLSHVKVNPYSFKDSGYFSTTPSPPNRTEPNTENVPPLTPDYDMGRSSGARTQDPKLRDRYRDVSPKDSRTHEKRNGSSRSRHGESLPKSAPLHTTSHNLPIRGSPVPGRPSVSRGQFTVPTRGSANTSYGRPSPGDPIYGRDPPRDPPSKSKLSQDGPGNGPSSRPRTMRSQTEKPGR